MIYIESKENSFFKETKKLKERKNRTKLSKYFIEGFRLVEEALKANANLEAILYVKDVEEKVKEILEKYNYKGKVFEISKPLFLEVCDTETPQGIGGVVKIEENDSDLSGGFYLLCDKVQDPGNLGTIIRTAHAVGVSGIILTKGTVDIYNEKVIRSTMGSIFYVNIYLDDKDFTLIKELKKKDYKIITTSLEESHDFFKADLSGNIVLTVGNEGNGVSEEIFSLSTEKVKIPMPGGAESLNVGIATSIILYEKLRQNLSK
ncbi:RNA methyltransferase [uncultured Clostridium sp.]|uniref:TrmH family RNA methyltransferase n=1 Tax=uncultured Clostridium sp. TaxID=59620 RepID=UPI002610D351|nr:RNA methyltransferase [uncultured Clostridium sp.]